MLRASEYIGLMKHGLGKTPDSRHNLWQTFNRAGRQLVTSHDWVWRKHGPVDLPAVAGQRFIILPEDFGRVETVNVDNATSANFFRVQQTTTTHIQQLYQHRLPLGDVGFYIAFPNYIPQRSLEEGPVRKADVYPQPDTDGNPTLKVIYSRTWIDIAEGDDDAIPNVPPDFQEALVAAARALAWRIEMQSPAFEEGELAEEIERLKLEDGGVQTKYSHMIGGASSRRHRLATIRLGIADVSA